MAALCSTKVDCHLALKWLPPLRLYFISKFQLACLTEILQYSARGFTKLQKQS